jgi:hypothetical protein
LKEDAVEDNRNLLREAVEYITEYHDLEANPLAYSIARDILVRTNQIRSALRIDPRAALRQAAAQMTGITEERAAFYRKAINAYWRFIHDLRAHRRRVSAHY